MIAVDLFKGKKIALFGLGGSGLATAQALIAGGAEVIAFDDKASSVAEAQKSGIATADLRDINWHDICALVLAPGVPLTHPEPHWSVKLARDHSVEIIGDIELFVRERNAFLAKNGLVSADCPFIAITGTNGKSTTTALIAHLLQQAGYDVQMGGNIGTAILSLDKLTKGRTYVIECSSYQIDLTPSLNPTVGILLNITPDHIDRHGTFTNYASIKERLVVEADTAIIALDDEPCRAIAIRLQQTHKNFVALSTHETLDNGWSAAGVALAYRHHGQIKYQLDIGGISSLRGAHNAQNALAALAACEAIGIDPEQIAFAWKNFKGLAHRMEEVARKGRVIFINDSKATNAEASAPALSTFDHIYWIAGGVAKEGGIAALDTFFPKIRKAYLIGEAAEEFATTIAGRIPIVMSATLENAVRTAAKDAAEDQAGGEIAVLLSPACASFDQFANYSARGDAFRILVSAL